MGQTGAWRPLVVAGLLLATGGAPGTAAEKSGKAWVAKYPGSRKVEDLSSTFRPRVQQFLKALQAAGAEVRITSTRRPRERAYLMHWSWRIATQGYDARKVPARPGVAIDWWHGSPEASRQRAREMVAGYGTGHLKVAPSLTSRHIEGNAIDMIITWKGTLPIRTKDGRTVRISSTPRDGTNAELIAVGKTYGVIHFLNVQKDRPHWSTDGR